MAYTYRLFLSWLIEQPALYEQVKHIVHVEDFLAEPYRQVAGAAIRAAGTRTSRTGTDHQPV